MKYTCKKMVERFYEKIIGCFKDPSTAPPSHYGNRFRNYCTKVIKVGLNPKNLSDYIKDYEGEFVKFFI